MGQSIGLDDGGDLAGEGTAGNDQRALHRSTFHLAGDRLRATKIALLAGAITGVSGAAIFYTT
jgi:hypothetical protein